MAQSILDLNRETYLEKAEKNLLQMSDSYYFQKKFKMGEGADEDKVEFYSQMYRLLCTDNCEMKDFIQNKIEGKLDELNIKVAPKQTISEILMLAKQYLETQDCTLDEAISNCCEWENILW